MNLDRRQFGALLTAALTALRPALAAGLEDDPPRSSGPETLARQSLNRLTFGVRPGDIEQFRTLGLRGWLERELAKPVSDRALAERLKQARLAIEYEAGKDGERRRWKAVDELRPYGLFKTQGAELLRLVDYEKTAIDFEERIRPAREVQAASLIRAVHADAQLREVMTAFWHEHFSVNCVKDEHTAAFFGEHDRIMRQHALGNFRQMLGEVVRSPSMLFFLNNESSKASPANENFARELLELHTLGAENYANDRYARWSDVPGARDGLALSYIDDDVYEAARALTGWSFGDGRYIAEGDEAPETGEFHYVDAWHDPYQKRILGVEFEPNAGPLADGEKLLDLLAAHPGTARFIARKLIRRLLADEPPEELVESVAGVFREQVKAPDQLAQVVRHLVLSPHFSGRPPTKLKRPFELLAALYRAVGAEVASPSLDFHWALGRCGWTQHEFRPPTGHPDTNRHWANTNYLSGSLDLALNAFEPWFGATDFDLVATLPPRIDRVDAAAQYFAELLLGPDRAQELAGSVAQAFEGELGGDLDHNGETRGYQLRALLALVVLRPGFLTR